MGAFAGSTMRWFSTFRRLLHPGVAQRYYSTRFADCPIGTSGSHRRSAAFFRARISAKSLLGC